MAGGGDPPPAVDQPLPSALSAPTTAFRAAAAHLENSTRRDYTPATVKCMRNPGDPPESPGPSVLG